MVAKKFSLLLLYNKISASLAVAHALNAKGLDVVAVDNHKDFINFINRRSVDLVGLSVNHPNESAIAEVLENSSQIPFFNFAEDTTPTTVETLKTAKGPIKISGVVSSYTIWMSIAPFVREKTDAHLDPGKVAVFGAKETPRTIGHVNLAETREVSIEGQIKFVDTPAARNNLDGVINVVQAEEVRIGKIGTLGSKKLKDHILKVLSTRWCRPLSSNEKIFPPLKKIKVVPVENENEKGFFVFSGDHLVADDHVLALKEVICKDVSIDSFHCGDLFEFDIPVENIVRWSLDNCLFSFLYEDQGRRMISYVRKNNLYPRLTVTEDGEMCGLSIDDLPRVPTVDFDLFIYFNRNDRKIPYIKNGDSIDQEKLENREGLETLYIKIEDRPKMLRIFIEASLKKLFK